MVSLILHRRFLASSLASTATVNVGSASRDTSIASQYVAETDIDIDSLMQGFEF